MKKKGSLLVFLALQAAIVVCLFFPPWRPAGIAALAVEFVLTAAVYFPSLIFFRFVRRKSFLASHHETLGRLMAVLGWCVP